MDCGWAFFSYFAEFSKFSSISKYYSPFNLNRRMESLLSSTKNSDQVSGMGIKPGGQLWTARAKRREGGLWTSLRWKIGKMGAYRGLGGAENPKGSRWTRVGNGQLRGSGNGSCALLQAVGTPGVWKCLCHQHLCVASFLSWKWQYQCHLYDAQDRPGSRRLVGLLMGGRYS